MYILTIIVFTKHLSKIGTALYFHVRWRTLKNIVLYHWNFMFVCFLFWSFENGLIRNRLYNVWVKNVFCGHVKDCDRSCAYNFFFSFSNNSICYRIKAKTMEHNNTKDVCRATTELTYSCGMLSWNSLVWNKGSL